MRMLLAVALIVIGASCSEHGEGGAIFCLHEGQVHEPGEFFPAGDGCNFCNCESNGDVSCSSDSCGDGGMRDASVDLCTPAPICGDGVDCFGICCKPGEQCQFGACSCGGAAPCIDGDICAAGGPVGGQSCGSICCGLSGPCPN